MKTNLRKVIISGGGTGGHIYPAIAIANTLQERFPEIEILFVGALGKMEMEKVPKAGYEIVGLPISGIQRKLTFKNLLVPFKLLLSMWKAKSILKTFKPQVVIGVGGYASGPMLKQAINMNIPVLIQEQNSYAGLTNKILAKEAGKICVAYEGMTTFFPADKVILTGNPVRKDILNVSEKREEALAHFGLDSSKKTLLVLGGSLGARTINESIKASLKLIKDHDVQLIWQTGKFYYKDCLASAGNLASEFIIKDFIYEMDLVYAAADLVISRAGALSVSELCLANKATIFVPSPNVAEDHQTKNALALTIKKAALMIKDIDAQEKLVPKALELLSDQSAILELEKNIATLAKPNAADEIADEIYKLVGTTY